MNRSPFRSQYLNPHVHDSFEGDRKRKAFHVHEPHPDPSDEAQAYQDILDYETYAESLRRWESTNDMAVVDEEEDVLQIEGPLSASPWWNDPRNRSDRMGHSTLDKYEYIRRKEEKLKEREGKEGKGKMAMEDPSPSISMALETAPIAPSPTVLSARRNLRSEIQAAVVKMDQLRLQSVLVREREADAELQKSVLERMRKEEEKGRKSSRPFHPLEPLTHDDISRVRDSMGMSSAYVDEREVLCSGFNIEINRSILSCLRPTEWLNDEVVNFYGNLVRTWAKEGGLEVWIPNTFFYAKLLPDHVMANYNYKNVRRWTKRAKVDIFSLDAVFIPLHLGMHWTLAVIDMKSQAFEYYDSMGGGNSVCFAALRKYLNDESMDKKGVSFDASNWPVYMSNDSPRQRNGYDCGVFMCQTMNYLGHGAELTFSQNDMGYFRQRMCLDIVSYKLC